MIKYQWTFYAGNNNNILITFLRKERSIRHLPIKWRLFPEMRFENEA